MFWKYETLVILVGGLLSSICLKIIYLSLVRELHLSDFDNTQTDNIPDTMLIRNMVIL